MKTEREKIDELINPLCNCIHPDADIDRLRREVYERIKGYADNLAIEFVSYRSSNGFPPKWVLKNELQLFKSDLLRKVPKIDA